MDLRKIHHTANFRFARGYDHQTGMLADIEGVNARLEHLGEGVSKLQLRGPRWQPHGSFIELHDSAFDATSRVGDVSFDAGGRLSITCDDREITTGDDNGTIGVSGSAWLLRFKE
ncbi:MAG: hypothetical protein AAF747_11800, partial [Planctomycetota bacterium]